MRSPQSPRRGHENTNVAEGTFNDDEPDAWSSILRRHILFDIILAPIDVAFDLHIIFMLFCIII